MTTTETTTITMAEAAAIVAGDYTSVPQTVRAAVLYAILTRGRMPLQRRVSPQGLVMSLPVTVRAWDEGGDSECDVDYGSDYEAAARSLWARADYGDEACNIRVRWEAIDATGEIIADGSFVFEYDPAE